MPSTEIALRTLEDYAGTGKYNVVAPVITVQADGSPADSPYLVGAVSLVKINPSQGSGETYTDFRFAKESEGKVALTSLALTKFAQAAGIHWMPDLCRILKRERRPDGNVYVAYQAGAGIRSSSGEIHVEIATKEIDTEDIGEQLAEGYRRKLDSGRAKFKAEDIDAMVRRELLQIREHVLSLAETKAKSRCIRRILAIPQVFSKQDLARPFAVPRLVIDPARLNPEQLAELQLQGRRATTALFGEERDAPSTDRPSSDARVPAPLAISDEATSRESAPGDVAAGQASGQERSQGAGTPSPTGATTTEAVGEQGGEGPAAFGEGVADPEPLEDLKFFGGPHKGEHFSEVILSDPGYVEQVAKGHIKATDKIHELAGRWWAAYQLEKDLTE